MIWNILKPHTEESQEPIWNYLDNDIKFTRDKPTRIYSEPPIKRVHAKTAVQVEPCEVQAMVDPTHRIIRDEDFPAPEPRPEPNNDPADKHETIAAHFDQEEDTKNGRRNKQRT